MFALGLGVAAYTWAMIHRFRLAWLERQHERFGLEDALKARRAEAAGLLSTGAGGEPGDGT